MTASSVTEPRSVRVWRRDERLRQLGYDSYDAYVRSPEWADVRRRYFKSRKGFGCALCRRGGRVILHHRTYERVGGEDLEDLVALCPTCHAFVHGLERDGYIGSLDPGDVLDLSDEARQTANRELEKDREASQRTEYVHFKSDEWMRQKIRTRVHKLRDAQMVALK